MGSLFLISKEKTMILIKILLSAQAILAFILYNRYVNKNRLYGILSLIFTSITLTVIITM
jgi:hypothetical protein